MKTFTVIAPIALIDLATGKPATETPGGPPAVRTFGQWAFAYVLSDERARGGDIEAMHRMATKVVPAFSGGLVAGDTVVLEDADYALLLPIVKAPRAVIGHLFDSQMYPFHAAFLAATDTTVTSGNNAAPQGTPLTSGLAAAS